MSGAPSIKNPSLTLKTPVPADIDIAQEAATRPITDIADALGIEPDELELYGPLKAKVNTTDTRKQTAEGEHLQIPC